MEFPGKFYIKKRTLFLFLFLFFLSLLSIQLALYGLVGYFCQKKGRLQTLSSAYKLRNFERHHEDYDDETFTTGVFSLNGHGPRPVPCCSRNISWRGLTALFIHDEGIAKACAQDRLRVDFPTSFLFPTIPLHRKQSLWPKRPERLWPNCWFKRTKRRKNDSHREPEHNR